MPDERVWITRGQGGIVEHVTDEEWRYMLRYRGLTPEQQQEVREFAAYLAKRVRKHPDCVATMCGRSDCDGPGPCYVGPSAAPNSASHPRRQGVGQ